MSEPLIGTVILWAGSFAPRGWAFCNGQLLSVAQNSALFSILGTTYGGDGRSTFALPDMRSRVPVGSGTGPGLHGYKNGQQGGTESVTLTEQQMPSHTHLTSQTPIIADASNFHLSLMCNAEGGESTSPVGSTLTDSSAQSYNSDPADVPMSSTSITSSGSIDITGGNTSISPAGGSHAHTNIQPYLGMNFIIALVGIYPSRS